MNRLLMVIALCCASHVAMAELTPWEDYDIGESVMSVTTVKVDANMMDVYLEGLKQTWVAANKVAKELGHISDYSIYSSQLPQSGDFNLMLVIVYDSIEGVAPSKERYDAFMERWGKETEERNREISAAYPDVRSIAGEYLVREITMK